MSLLYLYLYISLYMYSLPRTGVHGSGSEGAEVHRTIWVRVWINLWLLPDLPVVLPSGFVGSTYRGFRGE